MVNFLHSYWAYIVLIALFVATINAWRGRLTDSAFLSRDFRISLFALITVHLQLLLGLLNYFTSDLATLWGMDGIMSNSVIRLLLLEHPLINIIAVILITIGWSKHKKSIKAKSKFSKIALFYTLGLILILSRVPWKIWFS